MAKSRSSMLVPNEGDSVVGGITVEVEAIRKMSQRQLKKNLRREIRGLEEMMWKAIKEAKASA